jgi:ribonuclease E
VSARDIVGGLAGAAISAARNPLGTTARAVGLAKGVASTGAAAAEGLAQHAADRMRRHHAAPGNQRQPVEQSEPQEDPGSPEPSDASAGISESRAEQPIEPAVKKAAKKAPATKAAAKKAPAKKTAPKKTAAKRANEPVDDGPQIVLREPAPPELPPIDVVGQALAAEAAEEPHAGRAGEPRGASRDEEHGEAALQRAEADEIAEETAEALPGGDVDVTTPVGTTGAGAGFNPDTAEADLQQPQTPPVVDPALTKTVKSAQRTGKKASTKNPKS